MKKTLQNTLKVGAVIALMLSAGAVSAQIKTATAKDFTKAANTVLGQDGGSVRVIDNKGTIKYLQTANGLTTFTNTAPNGGIVTTWQLGGELSTDTNISTGGKEFKITLDSGGEFIINDMTLLDNGVAPATIDGDGNVSSTGYTLLVRDEGTGEIKKLLATDLVNGIRLDHVIEANSTTTVPITVIGLPALDNLTTMAKLFVFRNGAKLRAGTDFSVAANVVTLNGSESELPLFDGDQIEIQYIK